VDPRAVCGDPAAYRRYIQRSKAEFMVAKNIYVETRCGWFSDRSICYLASGKPVLAQDTGLGDLYPTGQGLVTFAMLDEAVAGVEEITGDYGRHARARSGAGGGALRFGQGPGQPSIGSESARDACPPWSQLSRSGQRKEYLGPRAVAGMAQPSCRGS